MLLPAKKGAWNLLRAAAVAVPRVAAAAAAAVAAAAAPTARVAVVVRSVAADFSVVDVSAPRARRVASTISVCLARFTPLIDRL